jgi:hypothetical protein
MKIFFTIFTIEADAANYKGVSYGSVNASEYLLKLGYQVYHTHIKLIVEGIMVRDDVLIIRHEVEDWELITPELEKRLKLAGIKAAKAVLRNRRK